MSQSNTTEAKRAQTFAKGVFAGMCRERGFEPGEATPEDKNDIFATMNRQDRFYSRGFAQGLKPRIVAQQIQSSEWDNR